MANTLFFLIALPLPAVIAFFSLWWSQDAIITMTLVGLLGFILPIWVYDKFVGDFSYERKIPSEVMDKGAKISAGMSMMAGAAIGLGALLVLYVRYCPSWMGPKSIRNPMPEFPKWSNAVYQSIFGILFLIFAALEHFYFNYFASIEYTEGSGMASLSGEKASFSSNLIISLFCGLFHFAVYYWIIEPVIWYAIVYAVLAFLMNMVVISVRHSKKLIVSTLLRIGIAMAVLIMVYYCRYSVGGKAKRSIPYYFFRRDNENKLTKWFTDNQ